MLCLSALLTLRALEIELVLADAAHLLPKHDTIEFFHFYIHSAGLNSYGP